MALKQPDRSLLELVRLGDERAFGELMRTYQPSVLSYVHRMVGDLSLAEDLVQDVFLRMFRRAESFRGQCLFTTWLFQIAKNRVLDELRAQARRPSTGMELSDRMIAPEHAPGFDMEADETVDAIWRAVSKLDVERRVPLLLRDVAGLPYREIAETLEIELATVKWRIYSARAAIQASLASQELSPEFARMKSVQKPLPLEPRTTSAV